MQPNQIKPGFATTEFWASVASMIAGIFILFKLVPIEQAQVFSNDLLQFFNICVQIVTLLGSAYIIVKPWITYIRGRVVLKTQQLQQSLNQTPKAA